MLHCECNDDFVMSYPASTNKEVDAEISPSVEKLPKNLDSAKGTTGEM
jgi:hypothetical protein